METLADLMECHSMGDIKEVFKYRLHPLMYNTIIAVTEGVMLVVMEFVMLWVCLEKYSHGVIDQPARLNPIEEAWYARRGPVQRGYLPTTEQ